MFMRHVCMAWGSMNPSAAPPCQPSLLPLLLPSCPYTTPTFTQTHVLPACDLVSAVFKGSEGSRVMYQLAARSSAFIAAWVTMALLR